MIVEKVMLRKVWRPVTSGASSRPDEAPQLVRPERLG